MLPRIYIHYRMLDEGKIMVSYLMIPYAPHTCHHVVQDKSRGGMKRCEKRMNEPHGLYCHLHVKYHRYDIVNRCTALRTDGHQCRRPVGDDPMWCGVHAKVAGRHEFKDMCVQVRRRDHLGRLK